MCNTVGMIIANQVQLLGILLQMSSSVLQNQHQTFPDIVQECDSVKSKASISRLHIRIVRQGQES